MCDNHHRNFHGWLLKQSKKQVLHCCMQSPAVCAVLQLQILSQDDATEALIRSLLLSKAYGSFLSNARGC